MDHPLFDAAGKPIPKKPPALALRAIRHWKPFLQPAATVLAIAISGISLHVALRTDRRETSLARLDHDPVVFLRAELGNIPKLPLQIELVNYGSVEAVNVGVRMISHGYDAKMKTLRVHRPNVSEDRFIDALKTHQTLVVPINATWLKMTARLEEPTQHNVLEIRVTYQRTPDLKQYDKSAFYFLTPDGKWRTENDVILANETYRDILSAAAEFSSRNGSPGSHMRFTSDPLHENKDAR